MKKFIIAMAAIALTLTSCTNESVLDVETPDNQEQAVQKTVFDIEDGDGHQRRPNLIKFYAACKSLLEVHKDFENFRALLNNLQLAALDSGRWYDLDMAVSIIFAWLNNEETFDVMCEFPDWDDFLPNMPEKYFKIYPFYM